MRAYTRRMPDVADPADEDGPGTAGRSDGAFPATDGPPPFAPPDDDGTGDDADLGADAAGPETATAPSPDDTHPTATAEGEPAPDAGPPTVDLSGIEAGIDDLRTEAAATAREETVTTGLAGLQKGVDELVRLTRRADEHVAELHAENQRLRAGEIEAATRPLLRDLVRLHDEVLALTAAAAEEARDDLGLVRSRLVDALARWGLTADAPEHGAAMDPTRHHGVGTVPATDDDEPGTIASVRRIGFVHDDGRVLRAAEVEVFRAPPPPTEPDTDATTADTAAETADTDGDTDPSADEADAADTADEADATVDRTADDTPTTDPQES